MEIRQVEYVVGVVDAGTFTAAAAALHVAQPSLSQGIARLEAELGTALFHRVGRGAVLSAAGGGFAAPARRVLRGARGRALFHGGGRGAVLSGAGEAFVARARRMLREARLARESGAALSEVDAGSLDRVALPTLAADPVAVAVGRFRRAHPGVVVRI